MVYTYAQALNTLDIRFTNGIFCKIPKEYGDAAMNMQKP